ncbi:hypothetical protein [Kribbella catacumbae]|uniref:hypothetical protein n=1 Tax=Kribbella catacumbae TaxID=460086 RepID=UPI000380CB9B|nr:hypothetical protein [Kribbella catacumbae]
MLALGIVLIVLAVLFALGVSVSSGDSTTMSVFGVDFGLSVPTLFFIGVLAGIAVTLGLWLTKKGLGRDFRRRKEVRELRQKVAGAPGELEGDRSDVDVDETDADSRTVDLSAGDRLADEQHTVADGTDSPKQPH